MSKILIVAAGLRSVVYPTVELGRRLGEAGHQVAFAGEETSRGLVESQGIAFQVLEESRYDLFLKRDSTSSWVERWLRIQQRREEALDSLAMESFEKTLHDLRPDLVLIDGEMHEQILAAAGSRTGSETKIALLNSFASIWRRPGLPPAHRAVRPGVGWRGSALGMRSLWWALRLGKARRAALLWLRRAGCDRLSLLQRLARRYGLDLEQEVDADQWLIPFTYRNLPVLSLHALELEFPHRPPPQVRYVGPMLLRQRPDGAFSGADRQRLDAILARRRGDSERRLIYAGFGSVFSTDPDFLRRLFAAAGQHGSWDLVVSAGPLGQAPDLSPPANVHPFAWLPQLEVLAAADAAVTHGGINTLDECIDQGVPMLVYSGGETDMAGNSARVEHHGLGIAGDRRRDDARAIQHHIQRLLAEAAFRDRVEALRRAFRAYGDDRVAETFVEEILAGDVNARWGGGAQ